MRLIKFILGVFGWPLLAALALSLYELAATAQHSSLVTSNHIGFIAGFGFWILLYFTASRPLRAYILGHELTHALWAWMMGAKVSGMHVAKTRGHVYVSKTNFLITLAPYFFPFYTVVIVLVYAVIALFYDQKMYDPFWMGCIGLTFSFHLTFTLSMIAQRQPDILEHGRIFSYTVIALANILLIMAAVVAITPATLEEALQTCTHHIIDAYSFCFDRARVLAEWSQARISTFNPNSSIP